MDRNAYVLDAYAVMAYLQDEVGADIVAEVLEKASEKKIRLFMHLLNLGEVYYNVYKEDGEAKANTVYATIKKYPVEFVSLTEESLLKAARIKGKYPISYDDAFAVVTSIDNEAALISGDPELSQLQDDGLIELIWR
ncbi:MAG: type II toxin-antitoxin system VapC family toxin [bacterium]